MIYISKNLLTCTTCYDFVNIVTVAIVIITSISYLSAIVNNGIQ